MNKAELKAKADEYFNCVNCHSYADTREDLQEDVTQAYIAGYEARNGEVKILKEKIHWWKKEVNVAHRAREDEFEKLVIENKALKRNLNEVKEIVENLLYYVKQCTCERSNYAEIENDIKQAEKFIKEVK